MRNQLDHTALDSFQRDGFVTVRDVTSSEEVDRLHSILMTLHKTNAGFAEGAQFDAVGLDGEDIRRFPQIINPHNFAPELLKSDFYQVAAGIAKQLLGESARFKADISLLKPALIGSKTPWHQDEAFGDPALRYYEVSIWLALTPAMVENSCMSFLPGSHKFPVLEHRPLNGDPRIHTLECIGNFDAEAAVACPISAGSCTIHTHRTLHCAGPNISKQPRLAYVLIFDATPEKLAQPRNFPWLNRAQQSARTIREQQWRRHGGLLLHAWRQRHRIRFSRVLIDMHRARVAVLNMIGL